MGYCSVESLRLDPCIGVNHTHKPHNNDTTATFDFDYNIDDEVHLNVGSTVQDQDDVTKFCPAFQTSLSPALELKQPPLKSLSNAAVRPMDTSHF